jgi:hypothetical protein
MSKLIVRNNLIAATPVYNSATVVESSFTNTGSLACASGGPAINRLRMEGAPGAMVQGNTVTIQRAVNTDVYEFRGSTPPVGGTNGRIWVYNGVDAAASRANLIKAINGTVDVAVVTRTAQDINAGTNTALVSAVAGDPATSITVGSSAAIGDGIFFDPNRDILQCSETLASPNDVWDGAIVFNRGGCAGSAMNACSVTITAAMIAKGSVEVFANYLTDPSQINYLSVTNRSRPLVEPFMVNGDATVSLILSGGGAPNTQPADIVDFMIIGWLTI